MAIIFLVFTISTIAGFSVLNDPESEVILSDVGELWASDGSLAREAGDVLERDFNEGVLVPRVKASMILMDRNLGPSDSLLSKAYLEEVLAVEDAFTTHPEYVERVTDDGETVPTCFLIKKPGNCLLMSPIDYWRQPNGVIDPFEDSETAVWERTFPPGDQNDNDPTTMPLFRNNVIRGPLLSHECVFDDDNDDDGSSSSIDSNCSGQWNEPDRSRSIEKAWENWGNRTDAFRLTFWRLPGNVSSESWDEYFLNYQTPEGFNLEVIESSHGNFLLDDVDAAVSQAPPEMFIMTASAIIVFLLKVFFKRDFVASQMVLGLTGLMGTVMAILTGCFGLVALGAKVSVTTVIVPVVIASIGVDDMFLITDAFEETSPVDPISTRIKNTLRSSGLAITMTTVTDALAFLVGAFSPIPAVASMSCKCVCVICFETGRTGGGGMGVC